MGGAGISEEARVELSANLQKLSEHRDRVSAIRLQAEMGGAVKTRPQRFLAELRAIRSGQSQLT
eukprot:8357548-Alexandrium_andersonii.AAC.1